MNLRYESLHNHTTASDGTQTSLELLASAEANSFGVMAITDHDVLPTPEIMKQLRAYAGPVKWTVGIELSMGLPKELGGFANGSLHLLGLFIDIRNRPLVQYLDQVMAGRIERVRRMVAHASDIGLVVTIDEVMAEAAGAPPGSPHMVRAVLSHKENVERLGVIEADLKRDAATKPDLQELYDRMVASGPSQRPYGLFMKRSSYLPMPDDDIGDELVDLEGGVKLIRDAGGAAILAHWYFHEKKFPREALSAMVATGRLDGLELGVANTQDQADNWVGTEFLQGLAKQHNLLTSVGIDAHYEADFEVFRQSRYAEMSIGQTARVADRLQVNLDYSSLS